jgi:predicted aminopeptidase
MLAAARPIDDWLADPDTPPALQQQLERARAIRAFASRELALPDNRSYTAYADLKRAAVVWNVFATPALSLQLKTWCYPLFGCVSYRGYFDREAAHALAAELRAAGDDVYVSPIPAYSTLGWMDWLGGDPLLNTFIGYAEAELARVIFHELAHQVVYVKDDSVFNESFATTVERAGVHRWLAAHGDEAARAEYARLEARRADFVGLLLAYRQRLEQAYAHGTEEEKRERKGAILAELQREYMHLKLTRWNGWAGYDRFFAQALGNAHLAAVGAYHDLVPAFEALLARLDGDLGRFFVEVKRLAALSKTERDAALRALAPSTSLLATGRADSGRCHAEEEQYAAGAGRQTLGVAEVLFGGSLAAGQTHHARPIGMQPRLIREQLPGSSTNGTSGTRCRDAALEAGAVRCGGHAAVSR